MIHYRDATISDGPALDAMARAIWLETFGHSAKPADIDLYLATAYGPTGKLLRDLADPAIAFHLAYEGDRIVGYTKVGAPFLADAEPGAVQLSQLYVVSDRHGSGIAGVLMDWSVNWARSKGAPALLLTVWEENPRAIAFYKRRGFEQVGEYAFPVGEQIDRDLVLRLAL
jgi:GNAT superfamily N-acetyltransferase